MSAVMSSVRPEDTVRSRIADRTKVRSRYSSRGPWTDDARS